MAAAVREVADRQGLRVNVAYVEGDDLRENLSGTTRGGKGIRRRFDGLADRFPLDTPSLAEEVRRASL